MKKLKEVHVIFDNEEYNYVWFASESFSTIEIKKDIGTPAYVCNKTKIENIKDIIVI